MWLPWEYAVTIGVGLALAGVLTRRSSARPVRLARPFLWESVTILFLYALWQWGGRFNLMDGRDAVKRGQQILDLQDTLRLPSELSLQKLVLPHEWLVQFSNIYYAAAHVPTAIIVLIWLFAFHRRHYYPVRNVLAITTAVSLFTHLVPVAPPRLIPGSGFVDTALLYNQSVYGPAGTGVSDQFAALPSVHVLWAVLVGVGAVWASRSRWRWLVVLHPLLTLFVVADTANHYWLDGVAAVILIPPAWWLQDRVARRWQAWHAAHPHPLHPHTAAVEAGSEPADALDRA